MNQRGETSLEKMFPEAGEVGMLMTTVSTVAAVKAASTSLSLSSGLGACLGCEGVQVANECCDGVVTPQGNGFAI